MKPIISVVLINLIHASFAQALSITTLTGYELSGFSTGSLTNSDYNLTTNTSQIQVLKSKTGQRELQLFKNNGAIEHIYLSDQRTPGRSVVTSVVVENGKIKSQLNCVNLTKLNVAASCFAITKDVCDAVLMESGKKTFADFDSDVKKCADVLNAYDRAISKPSVQRSIEQAYEDTEQYVKKENPILENLHRLAFPGIFGNVPNLKSAGSVSHMTDYRLSGLINMCGTYLNDESLANHPPAVNARQPKGAAE